MVPSLFKRIFHGRIVSEEGGRSWSAISCEHHCCLMGAGTEGQSTRERVLVAWLILTRIWHGTSWVSMSGM